MAQLLGQPESRLSVRQSVIEPGTRCPELPQVRVYQVWRVHTDAILSVPDVSVYLRNPQSDSGGPAPAPLCAKPQKP